MIHITIRVLRYNLSRHPTVTKMMCFNFYYYTALESISRCSALVGAEKLNNSCAFPTSGRGVLVVGKIMKLKFALVCSKKILRCEFLHQESQTDLAPLQSQSGSYG